MTARVHPFSDPGSPGVRGFLHPPEGDARAGLVLTHGAGADCNSGLLVALAESFAKAGILVLRCDLPFRQARPNGPPRPGDAALDREGLRKALDAVRSLAEQPLLLAGHSYGGRQASMLLAEDSRGLPAEVKSLLLLSYPLHPPAKPTQLRTAHFPQLHTPALFVHGSRDGFGSQEEMEQAIRAIPASTRLLPIQGAGHDLGFQRGKQAPNRVEMIVSEFFVFAGIG
ncbi:MAG: alpha/beta fold hydrolase [Candidatus Korobacteraceae bacterium]